MTGLRCGAPCIGAVTPGAAPDFVAIGKVCVGLGLRLRGMVGFRVTVRIRLVVRVGIRGCG